MFLKAQSEEELTALTLVANAAIRTAQTNRKEQATLIIQYLARSFNSRSRQQPSAE